MYIIQSITSYTCIIPDSLWTLLNSNHDLYRNTINKYSVYMYNRHTTFGKNVRYFTQKYITDFTE